MLTFLNKYKMYAIGLGVAILLWVVAAHFIDKYRVANQGTAEASLAIAQDSLHAALADGKTRDRMIVSATMRADSAGKRALTAQSEAARIRGTIPRLRITLDSTLSDSAQLAAAALLYDAMDSENDSLTAALEDRTNQVTGLTFALDSARYTIRTLTMAATHVDVAATAVVKTIRPSWFVRIAPKPGIGFAAGVDVTGKFTVVAGVTLSWPR